jgi:hypothetical protein
LVDAGAASVLGGATGVMEPKAGWLGVAPNALPNDVVGVDVGVEVGVEAWAGAPKVNGEGAGEEGVEGEAKAPKFAPNAGAGVIELPPNGFEGGCAGADGGWVVDGAGAPNVKPEGAGAVASDFGAPPNADEPPKAVDPPNVGA